MLLTMLRERRNRDGESGFTLIELLVVILIIGILAAIALPAFLGQRVKGQDSSAKSDVRNAVSQLESCYVTAQTYSGCDLAKAGLEVGTGKGQTSLTSGDGTGYVVVAKSQSDNTFTITKSGANGKAARTCTNTGNADGGCATNNGSW